MKNLISFNNFIKIILTFLFIINYVSAEKRLCGDIKCEVILSQGVATSNYMPPSPKLLSLTINANVNIFSKPAESGKNDLWEVGTQGRRGFVPKRFIKELKIFVKKEAIVQVEFQGVNRNILSNENSSKENYLELKSSESLIQDTTTTAPLNANEIPKDIIKESEVKNKLEENVVSAVIQEPLVDGTVMPNESQTNANAEDDAGVEVEDEEEADNDEDGEDDYEEDIYENDAVGHQINVNRNTILAAEIEKNIESEENSKSTDSKIKTSDSQKQDNIVEESKEESITQSGAISDNNKEKTETVTSENSQKTDNINENINDENLVDVNTQNVEHSANKTIEKPTEQNDEPKIIDPINNTDENRNLVTDVVEDSKADFETNLKENDILEDPKTEQPNQEDDKKNILEKNNDGTTEVKTQNNIVSTEENNQNLGAEILNKEFSQSVKNVNLETNIAENETKYIESTEENNQNLDNKNNDSEVDKEPKAEIPNQNNQDKNVDLKQNVPNIPDISQQVNLHEENNNAESSNLNHNHNHDHDYNNHNNHHHYQPHHHHHHHHHGLPPLFNRVRLPSTNTEDLEIKETINSDKIIDNNVLDTQAESFHLQTHNLTNEQHHTEIINNETDNKLHLQLYNENPEQNVEANFNGDVVTLPGYEENNYVDNPVEVTTQNPVVPNVDHVQENSKLMEPENQNNQFDEPNYNNQHNKDNNKIGIDPVTPLSLTQEVYVQEAASDSISRETSTDYGMSVLLEYFNSWTGVAFDIFNNFWNSPTEKKDIINIEFEQPNYPKTQDQENQKVDNLQYQKVLAEEYCEKIGPNDNCPNTGRDAINRLRLTSSSFTESDFFTSMSDKILEMFDMLVLLSIAAISSVFFAFGYYCICNSRKENLLINKLNIVERSLLAANKEVSILKQELQDSRSKLTSIEDSSYCTNDLVVNLKKELDQKQQETELLNDQISILEQELEKAASASVQLKKIIVEHEVLVNNLEELQKQENEHEDTIAEMNQNISEKTLENSNLHILLTEQSVKFESEIRELQNKMDDLEDEKLLIQSKFDESEKTIKEKLQVEINTKVEEMKKLENELQSIKTVYDDINRKWQTSESKIESLKECMRNMNKESWADIDDLIESVDIKADNLLLEKENATLQELLEGEKDARKLLEDHVKIISEEIATLKKEHNQAEKDKLEAQTRLDVLSNYFKEKEAQLQRDLTLKEALWMKQQGETTSTVEKIRALQDEVQALKLQNESLHAEIEAQVVTHKAQLAALENRNHETWLLSKQSERKYEEARSEATMLRRKLTTLVSSSNTNGNQSGGSNNTSTSNDINRLQNSIVDGIGSTNINNVPSPIHLESPSSPALIPSGLPPPPPFLPPPPFMPPLPGPFMGMPAPFALPPGGRPPPLGGRLMSPPPAPHRRSGTGRYSPSLIDDDEDDYDDYDYDDDRSLRRGGNGRNNRNYSPENGRYTPDSRYNYTTDVMSQYDTETDFSPQVSPREESFLRGRRGGSINRDLRHNDRSTPLERTNSSTSKSGFKPLSPSPQKNNSNSTDNRSNKSSKGSSSYSYSPTSSSSSSSSSSSLNDVW